MGNRFRNRFSRPAVLPIRPDVRTDRCKLTDAAARALPPATRGQYVVRDAELPGFLVVVGTRSAAWTVQCDVRVDGRRRTVRRVLGRVDLVSCRKARAVARKLLGELQSGSRRPVFGAGPTLREAWDRYRAALLRRGRRPRTVAGYAALLEGVLAEWLDTPLVQLAPALVRARHDELTRTRGPYQANRTMTALRAVYRHARRAHRGELPADDPCLAVDWNPEARRQTGAAAADLPAWWAQLQALDNPVRREFHLLMLLSGSRPDALRRARWEHVDVRRRVLRVPDPKGGPRRAFDMPLSRPMLACLARARRAGRMMHRVQAAEWIFPAATAEGCIRETKEDRARLAKWGGDLRQTYRTLALEAGLADGDVQLLMNHRLQGVSGGYVTTGALAAHLRAQQGKLSAFIVTALHQAQGRRVQTP